MTETARYDVLGVGNAIVDVIASVDEDFLVREGVAKGAMTLIDEARAEALYATMPAAREVSGGSAANTVAGVASLGGQAAYLGKTANDQLGEVFAHDIRAVGVNFETPPLENGPATARCLILVTPDAQRSMNTFLGASALFTESDIDADKIAASRIVYLEGYLFDREEAKQAYVAASAAAQTAGRRVALTLSDGFCVERHRESFKHLIEHHVDILFANETELMSLWRTQDFDAAVKATRAICRTAFLTRSEKGSLAVTAEETIDIAIVAPDPALVDTTGAGDLYAAGALFGLARGLPLGECGHLGALAASEAISHYGARPERNLRDLALEAGLLDKA